nr:unnamed protein product [Callosobruchus analis]
MLENRQYGRNYDYSAMTEGMDQALHYNNQIYKDDRLPCFHFTYHMQFKNLNSIKLRLHKESYNEKEKAAEYKEEIISAEYDCNIKLIWVPIPTGIAGNQQADRLAQKGRDQVRVHQNNALPGRSFLGMIKDKLWNQWTTRYKNWEQNKAHLYKIGAKDSPNCCCGEYSSLDHIAAEEEKDQQTLSHYAGIQLQRH